MSFKKICTNQNVGLKMSFKNMEKPKYWVKNIIQKYVQTKMLG